MFKTIIKAFNNNSYNCAKNCSRDIIWKVRLRLQETRSHFYYTERTKLDSELFLIKPFVTKDEITVDSRYLDFGYLE